MKKILGSLMLLMASAAFLPAEDIALTAPATKAGVDLLSAIGNRSVARQFVKRAVPTADLSSILWASLGQRLPDAIASATKANRTASVSGDNPYIQAYVLDDRGVFLYDPTRNLLKQVGSQDIRQGALPEFIPTQAFTVVFVADSTLLPAFLKGNPGAAAAMSHSSAGFAAQNLALAASAFKLSSIVMYNLKAPVFAEGAKLAKTETPLFLLQVGYTQ